MQKLSSESEPVNFAAPLRDRRASLPATMNNASSLHQPELSKPKIEVDSASRVNQEAGRAIPSASANDNEATADDVSGIDQSRGPQSGEVAPRMDGASELAAGEVICFCRHEGIHCEHERIFSGQILGKLYLVEVRNLSLDAGKGMQGAFSYAIGSRRTRGHLFWPTYHAMCIAL